MTEHIVSFDVATMFDMLSEDQVEDYIKNNPSKADAIRSILDANAKAKALQVAVSDFLDLLNTVELPDPPEGTLNIYNSFITETRHLTDGEKDEVRASNPNITKELLDARVIPTGRKVWKGWELNKSMTTSKATTSGEGKSRQRKLAVTVNKREGNTITPIGNFRTSKEACDHLNLDTKGDSARRVLEANKYIVDDYEGDQFLVSEK